MFKPEGWPLDLEHGSILSKYRYIWVWFIKTSFCAMSFSCLWDHKQTQFV